MSTFRIKYRLDETLYKNTLSMIKYAPPILIFILIWIFGNEVFISSNSYIEDIEIKKTNSIINQFGQTIYIDALSNDEKLSLASNSNFRYRDQLLVRMTNTVHGLSMLIGLFIYIIILIIL